MAPKDVELWKHAKFMAVLCPTMFSTPSKTYQTLRQLKSILIKKGADFTAPCCDRSRPVRQVLARLNGWNYALEAINVQMRERDAPGELEVLFFDSSVNERDYTPRIERAILLLHWLLAYHTCVTSIQVTGWGVFERFVCFVIFCDALSMSRHLRNLNLRAKLPTGYLYKLLSECRNLRYLEELALRKLYADDETGNMIGLAAVVASNANLQVLEVEQLIAVSVDPSSLLEALTASANISHLSLDVRCVRPSDIALFSRIFSENSVLTRLRLVGSDEGQTLTVGEIAKAVQEAAALAHLELVNFRIHTHDAWTLATSLAVMQTVRHLGLISCKPVFTFRSRAVSQPEEAADRSPCWRIQPYVHILRKVNSLQELTLNLLHFTREDHRAFFEALAANRSLKQVLVTKPHQRYPGGLFQIALETGTSNRIRTGTICTHETDFGEISPNCHGEQIVLRTKGGAFSDKEPVAGRCYRHLRTLDHLTDLTIKVRGDIDHISAELLALYLRRTMLLKAVSLTFTADETSTLLLLDGLSQNTSIMSLTVECWCKSRRGAIALADIVRTSSMIHTLVYNQDSMTPAKAFFSRFCKSLEKNFTILTVITSQLFVTVRNWAFIKKILMRNATFLERAAQFVADRWFDKSGAEALELVVSHPLLQSRVQHLMAVDELEAAREIRKAVVDLQDLDIYMRATGVVWCGVICEESTDGCPHCLDTLPADCWLAIRQYLAVADVLDPEPHSWLES